MVFLAESLNLADVAKMAMENEERGRIFYSRMAKKSDDPEIEQMFNKLAEEEIEHKQLFSKLTVRYEALPDKGALDKNGSEYIKTILGSHVFPSGADLEKVNSASDALGIGIEAEKESILLYQELMNRSQEEDTKKLLSDLLAEEKMHLIELRQYMNEFV